MRKIIIKHQIIIVVIMLSGCVSYYPQTVDIPLIKEKGDIRVDAGMFFIPDTHPKENHVTTNAGDDATTISIKRTLANAGAHATFSAGLTDVMAVQAYVSMDGQFRSHLQGALGLFKSFGNNMVTELYGGYGYGTSGFESNFRLDENNTLFGNYHLAFAQLNLGKTDWGSKHIDYGLGVKGGHFFCNQEQFSEDPPIYQKNGWMVEPSVFFRFGNKKMKICTKINYLWTNSVAKEVYYPLSLSFGVNMHFGKTANRE